MGGHTSLKPVLGKRTLGSSLATVQGPPLQEKAEPTEFQCFVVKDNDIVSVVEDETSDQFLPLDPTS